VEIDAKLIASLPRDAQEDVLTLFKEQERRKKRRLLHSLYPDKGDLRRELYRPHVNFFKAGKEHRERLMLAANRVGKSYGVGGYEVALHLTGLYPKWWEGRTFDHGVSVVAAGDTSQTVRDIIQTILIGPPTEPGTGLIPGDLIIKTKPKAGGVPDAIESVYVKHISGATSILSLKSYAEGRKSFQGTARDVVWLDEEPPLDVYSECLIRTMTCDGVVLCTFTPLSGMSEVVMSFLPGGKLPEVECLST